MIESNYSSYLWDHRAFILPFTLALPLVIQATSIAIKIFKNPNIVTTKIFNFKQLAVRSFTPQENETDSEFKIRLLKNTLIVTAFAAAVGAGVACPFVFLPASFAIPIALSVLFLAADVALNAESYQKTWTAQWMGAKEWLKTAFVPQQDETPQESTWRISKNVALVTLAGTAAAGASLFFYHFAVGIAAAKAAGTLTFWNISQFIPHQTRLVVFLEYASLGIAHGLLALKKWQEDKKGAALFHTINAALGFFFPYFYAFHGNEPMRIHHSFIGLFVSLLPLDTLKCLGSLITLDSLAYVFHPLRGYWADDGTTWVRWDFQNLLLENPAAYFGAYTTAAAVEVTSKNILSNS